MEQLSTICMLLCILCVFITPVTLVAWIVRIIRKSDKKKRAKRFFFGTIIVAFSFFIISFISFATECQHRWESSELIAPTCVNDGTQIYICKDCGEEKTEAVPAAHAFEETVVQEANCLKEGVVEKKCTICSKVENKTIAKTSHNYEVTSVKEATFEKVGVEERACSVCGDTEQTEISKLGTKENPGKVTVEQLVSEIKSDKDAAKTRYDGKWIEITGKVLDADSVAEMTRFCIYDENGGGLRIVCWVNKDMSKPFEYQGEVHTFLGQVREISTFNATEIGDCEIISE